MTTGPFRGGERVYIATDPLGPRGTFNGYFLGTKGMCEVRWDSGVIERKHYTELRHVQEPGPEKEE